MWILRFLLLVGAGALCFAIWWALGADGRQLGEVLSGMVAEPWTVVTLVDLYLGFFLIAVVICLYERNWPIRVFWALPVFFLGNVWAALWLIIRLPEMARRLNSRTGLL